MTTIEYALIAGLTAAVLIGAAVPVGRSLHATFGEIAATLDRAPDKSCGGAFCVEPAAGERPSPRVRRP